MKKILLISYLLILNVYSSDAISNSKLDNFIGIECSTHGPFLIDSKNKIAIDLYSETQLYELEYINHENHIELYLDFKKYAPSGVKLVMRYKIHKDSLTLYVSSTGPSGGEFYGESKFSCQENTAKVIKEAKLRYEKIMEKKSKRLIE